MSAPRPVLAARDRLRDVLAAGDVLVLSGAGISTDSGIPDYRGRDGVRRHAAPMTIDRFTSGEAEQRRYWARAHLGWSHLDAARPNAGHRAVAALQRAGRLTGIVTQNVDGLHQAAGATDVVDLHGRLDRVICLACGDVRSRVEVALRLEARNPGFRERHAAAAGLRPDGDVGLDDAAVAGFRLVTCRRCDGPLKPHVVYFGEHVPRDRFHAGLGMLARSRALLVLGSSLMVGSGYRFATAAARDGREVVIINRGMTRADHLATLRLDAGIAETLTPDTLPAVAGS